MRRLTLARSVFLAFALVWSACLYCATADAGGVGSVVAVIQQMFAGNVQVSAPADQQVLVYQAATGRWTAAGVPAAGQASSLVAGGDSRVTRQSAGLWRFDDNGATNYATLGSGGLEVQAAGGLAWSSTADATAAKDTVLTRQSAGVLYVSNSVANTTKYAAFGSGGFYAPANSGYAFTAGSDPASGIDLDLLRSSAGLMRVTDNGATNYATIGKQGGSGNGGVEVQSNGGYSVSPSQDATAAPDTTLLRQSAGLFRVTDTISATNNYLMFGAAGVALRAADSVKWSATSDATQAADTFLVRDAGNALAQRNGATAQAARFYNSFTSSTSFERFQVDWSSTANVCQLYVSVGSGGGSGRRLVVGGDALASDVAPGNLLIQAPSAWPQATVNTAGADLILAPGTGRHFYTILTATNLAGTTWTITISGVPTVLTEGVDWSRTNGDNNATAASLAAAINANVTIAAGCSALAVANKVYVTKKATTDSIREQTNAAGGDATVTDGGDGIIRLGTGGSNATQMTSRSSVFSISNANSSISFNSANWNPGATGAQQLGATATRWKAALLGGATVTADAPVIDATLVQNATSGTVNGAAFLATFADLGSTSTTVGRALYLNPTLNYTAASRTGSNADFQIDRVETSLATGTQDLILCRAGAAGTTTKFELDNTGTVKIAGSYSVTSGQLTLLPGAGANVLVSTSGLTCFGGTTASFPAIKRSSAAISFRLADDSADANINCATVTCSAASSSLVSIGLNATGGVNWATRSIVQSAADGSLNVNNQAGTNTTIAFTQAAGVGTYKNVATAGQGVSTVYAYGNTAGATGQTASSSTYTPTADGTFVVYCNVLVTTATTHSFTSEVSYQDEGGTARVATLSYTLVAGGTLGTLVVNTNGAVPYEYLPLTIRTKANQAITVRTNAAGTYTSVVYNMRSAIVQIG